MLRELKPRVPVVAVCGNGSLLIHTTRSPRCTVSVSGVKRVPSIVTVWVFGAASTPETALAATAQTATTTAKRTVRRVLAIVVSTVSRFLRHGRLQFLRVLEVRDESWPYLDHQRLQLLVLGVRNERLVERI